MMRRRFLSGLAIFIAALLLTAAPALAVSWTPPRMFHGDCDDPPYAATFDSFGKIHVAVSGQCRAGLWYVTNHRRVQVPIGNRFGLELSIAYQVLSGTPVVRIVWVDSNDRTAIWITRNDTGAWVSSRLWLGTAHTPSIANLGSGVAVAFRDGSHQLRYLSWSPGSGPTAPVVVATHCCSGAPALARHGGTTDVAYSEGNTGGGAHRLRLATRAPAGTWSSTTIDTHSTTNPSLAFSSTGAPVAAYEAAGSGVWWARHTSTGWHNSQAFGTGFTNPSIATDPSGVIALAASSPTVGAPTNPKNSVRFKRLDITSSAVVVVRSTDLSDDSVGFPSLGFHNGLAVLIVEAACSCAGGPDAGLWITHQQ